MLLTKPFFVCTYSGNYWQPGESGRVAPWPAGTTRSRRLPRLRPAAGRPAPPGPPADPSPGPTSAAGHRLGRSSIMWIYLAFQSTGIFALTECKVHPATWYILVIFMNAVLVVPVSHLRLSSRAGRENGIVENIRLVRLLDLTADFGVITNTKLTPVFKLRE